MNPLLSIIVPVYNAESTLDRCVKSILFQDYSNIEVIMVDDGSTDDSLDKCRQYAAKDERVVLFHKENGGLGSARNAGISIARGKLFAFVDADDHISYNAFSDNLLFFEQRPDVDFVQFPVVREKDGRVFENQKNIVNEGGGTLKGRENLYNAWLKRRSLNNYVCGKLFRDRVFSTLRFEEDMLFEDRFLMCDILNGCQGVIVSGNGRYYYTFTEGQITARAEDPYILKSKIKANLHIVENILDIKGLSRECMNRYYDSLFFHRRIKELFNEEDESIAILLKRDLPPIFRILSADTLAGIKLQLLLQHLRYLHA